MTSKSVGGWDLVMGLLYNDGWENELEPWHSSPAVCQLCLGAVTIHTLKKLIPMFGKLVTKHCTVTTCPDCLNEQVTVVKSKVKVRKGDNIATFKALSKEEQIQVLRMLRKI